MMLRKNQRFNDDNQFENILFLKNKHEISRIRRRPERDIDLIDKSFQSVQPTINKNDILTVYQPEDYAKLQATLTKRLQLIIENIQISREKNKLKDREIQIIAHTIQKAIEKINIIESKIGQKQKKLNVISLKCHDKTAKTSKEQQNIKKQSILLAEEIHKCQSLQADIKYLEQKCLAAQRELQNCKKIYSSLDAVELENQQLRQQYNQLQNEEKMIEYRQNNEKLECEEIQNKLEQLKSIYKERSKINKRNLTKLNTLKKQINNIEDSNNLMQKKVDQIKNLQLQLGELNQQFLLFNEDIAELDFKIRKKQKNISDLKQKIRIEKREANTIYNKRREQHQIVQSQEEISRTQNNSSKTSKNNSVNKNHQELSVNSKNVSPIRNRSNLTPTFPSNQLQGNIESNLNQLKQGEEMPNEAFKNIQKLINRFEQIKNKEKSKS